MKLEGTYTFNAAQDEVWDALQNPEVLASVMPGCEKLERIGEDEYEGVLKLRIGTMQGKFKGQIKLVDIVAPTSYKMILKGSGPLGFVNGEGGVVLSTAGDQTHMAYNGDAKVGGRLATVGQRLMERSAKAITNQSLKGLNDQIMARKAPAPVPAAAARATTTSTNGAPSNGRPAAPQPPPAPHKKPSEAQFAFGVAKEMAQDALKDIKASDSNKSYIAAAVLVGTALSVKLFFEWFSSKVARKVVKQMRENA